MCLCIFADPVRSEYVGRMRGAEEAEREEAHPQVRCAKARFSRVRGVWQRVVIGLGRERHDNGCAQKRRAVPFGWMGGLLVKVSMRCMYWMYVYGCLVLGFVGKYQGRRDIKLITLSLSLSSASSSSN